ncbi:MAG: regulatory iron-sulfur-containing complex subunit RicT [Bacteroidia bacterium]|nr:regulatory iron-sulfur-containing complex subunit RicT [Bacteroidia bacterium]
MRRWAEGIKPSSQEPPLVEVRFKGSRREIFWSHITPPLQIGEWVVTPELIRRGADTPLQIGKGYDIGQVTLTGYLAEKRQKALQITLDKRQKVLRRATPQEQIQLKELKKKEPSLLEQVRKLVERLGLGEAHQMKVTDVELTGDGRTLICYFTAEGRVDFRDLVRQIAESLNVRPEMRQLSAREETAQVGGIGPCGRELCCSSWLTSPLNITTEAARYQGLALNSSKITGLCGKLKCCINYELEAYKSTLTRIPQVEVLHTEEGEWKYLRTEILLERLWFEKVGEGKQVCLSAEAVRTVLQLNEKGQKPPSIEPYTIKFPDLPTRI